MPPPLPPRPCGFSLNPVAMPIVQIGMFLDLCCPFSSKMYRTVASAGSIVDTAPEGVEFVMHSVVQPWHPQSSYMHEASFAVQSVDSEKLRPFLLTLFERQTEFFDANTYDLSRAQVYDKLGDVAASVGVPKEAFLEEVACKGEGNGGNRVTQQIKWATKFHRSRGIHVTPTVLVNGIEAPQVSSGWTAEDWTNFLDEFK